MMLNCLSVMMDEIVKVMLNCLSLMMDGDSESDVELSQFDDG